MRRVNLLEREEQLATLGSLLVDAEGGAGWCCSQAMPAPANRPC